MVMVMMVRVVSLCNVYATNCGGEVVVVVMGKNNEDIRFILQIHNQTMQIFI